MNELQRVLKERDGLSESELADVINEMIEMVEAGESPDDVLREQVGLEPDFAFDLFDLMQTKVG